MDCLCFAKNPHFPLTEHQICPATSTTLAQKSLWMLSKALFGWTSTESACKNLLPAHMGLNPLKATGEFSLILTDRVDLNKCQMQNSFTHQAPVTAKIWLIWEKIETFLSCFQQTELYPTPDEHLPKGRLLTVNINWLQLCIHSQHICSLVKKLPKW